MAGDRGSGDGGRSGDSGGGGDRLDRYEHLIEHLQDAVVAFALVDADPIVRDVNPAFVEIFGYDEATVVGASLNDLIVPDWLRREGEQLDARTAAGQVNYRRVRRETADGLREFLYRGIPTGTGDGVTTGFAVYTDLTAESRRERQITVINRVLRHDLRNRLTVLAGRTSQLRHSVGDGTDLARTVDRVDDAVAELEGLVENVAAVHRLLDDSPPAEPRVNCVDLVESVVAASREAHPAAQIEASLPESAAVAATDALRTAVRALVENAVVHNPADAPAVRVAVTPVSSGNWIDLVVADDAPAIPEIERAVITGERDITTTRHGSGLGLWLTKWTVERFGGELSFGESDAGGNRVRLRLQRASEPR